MSEYDPTGMPEARKKIEIALHLVSTPIGAARDITLRGLDVLREADVLAAEDTRTLRHLMEIHGIPLNGRPMVPYHEHNGDAARPRIIGALQSGRSVAYASEAGTPLVADPGMKLARSVIEAGFHVRTAPGASAVLAALCVAGLPTDRFMFAGFAPAAAGARKTWLKELAAIPATMVLYESPKRVSRMLGELCEIFGEGRQAALCRELTKRFETVTRGSLAELQQQFDGQELRGEIVLVIDRGVVVAASEEDVEAALTAALAVPGARVKGVAAEVAERFDLPKRDVYQLALQIAADRGDDG